MGFTATDGETEGLARSHRGSTHPVLRLCPLTAVHPRFSTQLYLVENTLESAPLLFRGLQGSRGGRNLCLHPKDWESSAMIISHLVFPDAQHSLVTLLPSPQKAEGPISTTVQKGQRGEYTAMWDRDIRSPEGDRTVIHCHPCLAPAAQVSTFPLP